MKSILNENAYEDEDRRTGYGFWLYLLLFVIGYNGVKAAMGLYYNAEAYDTVSLLHALLTVLIALAATAGFFVRKRWTPLLFISFFLLNLLYMVYISVALSVTFPEKIDFFSLARVAVMCAVVISYLVRSERVREVFVE
ncbi:hypothetical protein GCM10023188_27500 [Pontibacter saemangeumensis]|uniref:DUF2569 domain-containing protein n=1 Tax=Pontibacter saemangeumensis TaxID=1084525 RepID=A0ABP8LU45_9BACT